MFLPATLEAIGHYVYRIDDPQNGRPFYVGKGQGNRAFTHIAEALAGGVGQKCERIREIRAAGREPRILIHRHGLDEATALHIEAALIDAFGLADLANRVAGHHTTLGPATPAELNARYGPPAEIPVPMMLIKIEQQWAPNLTPVELYERVRKYWVANPKGRTPEPKHAAAVAGGVIREVYRVTHWWRMSERQNERDDHRLAGFDDTPTAQRDRVGFDGEPDDALAYLRGRSVPPSVMSNQNPISYVNC
jgi:uncharacterized protein